MALAFEADGASELFLRQTQNVFSEGDDIHAAKFAYSELNVKPRVRFCRNDFFAGSRDNVIMSRRTSKPPRQLSHQWYLAEWAARMKVRQVDAVQKLGWSKAQASDLFTGKQRYTADLIDEVAAWLHLAPYELLMEPDDALAIRAMRSSAARINGPVEFAPRSVVNQ